MNDFSELEDRLRKLRPSPPSPELAPRIERALAEARHGEGKTSTPAAAVLPRERPFQLNWFSLGLGLAAAAALLLFARIQLERPTQKKPSLASISPAPTFSTNSNAQFVPAGLTQVVYHTADEGLQFPRNSAQPVRRVRSHTRETLQWRNPKTGASLKISYPREEVSLTPISGQ